MKKISRRNQTTFVDPGKAHCQKLHAKRRAKQRAGIDLSDQLKEHIVACIKKQKESADFKLQYVESQSKRLDMFEITFPGKEPVNFVYDRFRGTIVTFLYPEDACNVYHYYDIFKNKVNVKATFGQIWKLKGETLEIPGEVVTYSNGVWETENGRRLQLDNGELVEIM
jgi:hypothetical protein